MTAILVALEQHVINVLESKKKSHEVMANDCVTPIMVYVGKTLS